VFACLDLLVAWCHTYIKNASDTVVVDVEHHGTFYSVCQAVFYIMVFRHKELLAGRSGLWSLVSHIITPETNQI
jgi:RNA polymerase I-specific transcription initiation factor RRN3